MWGRSKRGWVGVDLGERAIKIAQVRRAGDGLRLASAAVYPRDAAGDFSLEADLRGARALPEGLAGSAAAATLSMLHSLVERAEPDQPPPDADRCVDGWSPAEGVAYTLSTAKDRVESTVDALQQVGWHCHAIDGPPLAIARVLSLSPDYRPDRLLAALDWGETCATLVAARGGQAQYVRRLAGDGFGAVRRAVAESLGLSENDAQRALMRHGAATGPAATPEARAVAEALRASLRELAREIGRTFDHLGAKLKTKPPERVYVLGAGALVPGLPELLGDAINAPVSAWRASGIERDPHVEAIPDALLAQAMALSALAWEGV